MIGGAVLFLLAMNLYLVLKIHRLESAQRVDRNLNRLATSYLEVTLRSVIESLSRHEKPAEPDTLEMR